MKTDRKTMAEVLRKAADNIENGLDKNDSIQAMYGGNEWEDRTTNDLCFVEGALYRIKPKTIILSNGVEIPKPLTKEQIGRIPCDIMVYGVWSLGNFYIEENPLDCVHYMNDKSIIYKTKEEAIEASKKLFGIE